MNGKGCLSEMTKKRETKGWLDGPVQIFGSYEFTQRMITPRKHCFFITEENCHRWQMVAED